MAERIYGARERSYGVTEREDGWIEVRVYNKNKDMRECLQEHIDDPRYFLKRCGAFSRSNIRAEKWLAEVMCEYRSYFEQGLVEIILLPLKR